MKQNKLLKVAIDRTKNQNYGLHEFLRLNMTDWDEEKAKQLQRNMLLNQNDES